MKNFIRQLSGSLGSAGKVQATNPASGTPSDAETLALVQMQPLLQGLPYLPHTSSSLAYSAIKAVLNDIIINNRTVVVEFGAGISTILISRMLQYNGLTQVQLISFDHDEGWTRLINHYLEQHVTGTTVQVTHAPMAACTHALDNNQWYQQDRVLETLSAFSGKIDCVVVDGPLAYKKKIAKARYPAYPVVKDMMAPRFSLFLDDTNRPGESEILQLWAQEGNLKVLPMAGSFQALMQGDYYTFY